MTTTTTTAVNPNQSLALTTTGYSSTTDTRIAFVSDTVTMALDDADEGMLVETGNQAAVSWANGSSLRGLNSKDGRVNYNKAASQTGVKAAVVITDWRRFDNSSANAKFRRFAPKSGGGEEQKKDNITVMLDCILSVDKRGARKDDGKLGRIESHDVPDGHNAVVKFEKDCYFQAALDKEQAKDMLEKDPSVSDILHAWHTLHKEVKLDPTLEDKQIAVLVEARAKAISFAVGADVSVESDPILALIADDALWNSSILPHLVYRNVPPYSIPDTSAGRKYEQATLDRNPSLNLKFILETALNNYEVFWPVVKGIAEWAESAGEPSVFVASGVPKPSRHEREEVTRALQDPSLTPEKRAELEARERGWATEIREFRFNYPQAKYEDGYTPNQGDLCIVDGLKQKVGAGLVPGWRQQPMQVLEFMRFFEVGTLKLEAKFDPRCVVPYTIKHRAEELVHYVSGSDALAAECKRIMLRNPLRADGEHEKSVSLLFMPPYYHQSFMAREMQNFKDTGGITVVGIEASGADAKAVALWLTNSDGKSQPGKDAKPSEPCIEASIVGSSAAVEIYRKADHTNPVIAELAEKVLNGRIPMHQPEEGGEELPKVQDGVYLVSTRVTPVVLFARIFNQHITPLRLPAPVNEVWRALGPLLASSITGIVRFNPNVDSSLNMGNLDRQSEKVRQATSAATGFLATLPQINVGNAGPHYVVPRSLMNQVAERMQEQARVYIPAQDNVIQSLKYSPTDVYIEAGVPISARAAQFLLTSGTCKSKLVAKPTSLTGEDLGRDFTFPTMASDVDALVNRGYDLFIVADLFPNSPAYRRYARDLPTAQTDRIFCAAYANKSAEQRTIYMGQLLQELPKVQNRLSAASIAWDPQRTPFLIVAINSKVPTAEEAMRLYTEKRMRFAGAAPPAPPAGQDHDDDQSNSTLVIAKEPRSTVQVEEIPDDDDGGGHGTQQVAPKDQELDALPDITEDVPQGETSRGKRKRAEHQEDDDLIIVDRDDDGENNNNNNNEQGKEDDDDDGNPFQIQPKRSKRA